MDHSQDPRIPRFNQLDFVLNTVCLFPPVNYYDHLFSVVIYTNTYFDVNQTNTAFDLKVSDGFVFPSDSVFPPLPLLISIFMEKWLHSVISILDRITVFFWLSPEISFLTPTS